MTRNVLLGIMLVMLAGLAWPVAGQDRSPAEPEIPVEQLAEQAKSALDAGDYQQAINRYEQLRQRLPQQAEVPYNMGVAAFRSGDYQRASELFAQALSMAGEGPLRSDSAYNLGTSAYAQSLNAGQSDAQQQLGRIDQAQSELQRALRHYRQALDIDPDDADAKANAELAYRRLKALEQMKRQMQQSQSRQGEMQQNQDQQPDQQQQQQQQDEQDQSDEQQNEQRDRDRNDQDRQQQQQPDQQQDQQQSQQQQQQDQQSQQAPRPPQPQRDEQRDEQAPRDQAGSGHQGPAGGGEAEPDPIEPPRDERTQSPPRPRQDDEMSRDEAERLLQMIRDKERQRKKQQQQERASRRQPVDKDW